MDEALKKKLKEKSRVIRQDIIEMLCEAGSGHPGGSLELFYQKAMPARFFMPRWQRKDTLINLT